MKKLCITTGLIAGVGLVGASALADNDLATSQTRENSTPSVFKNATTPTDFSAGAAGVDQCFYDNYNPLDDFGAPASQKDSSYPFYAEAADDFTLPGDPTNDCLLSEVIFAVAFFNGPGGETPFDCWDGVNITIFEDAAEFCGPGFLKGPAGEPMDQPPQNHLEYCPGGVVCEIKKSLNNVTGMPLENTCTPAQWEIIVSGLEEWQCKLQKERKYWIAIAPEQLFSVCAQTAIALSGNEPVGHPAQQIFLLIGLLWTEVVGNADACPPDTPPVASKRDLAIGIAAIKQGGCPWDLNGDGNINAADLAILLGQWNNPYGPAELARLLGAWGSPC